MKTASKPKRTSKEALKDLIFGFLGLIYPHLKGRASILMYHSVGQNGAFFAVAPEMFERQLQYLASHNYRVLKLSELVERLDKGESLENTVCLTFDDGYADNYETVFPLLKKYKMPISLFLTTGLIGESFTNSEKITLPLLTQSQIQEMHDSGLVEFLPHGEHHKKLHALSKEEALSEIQESMNAIEKITGTVPKLFAYPSGRYSAETIALLEELGFRATVTVQPGLVSSLKNPFELPRNAVDSKTSFVQFRGKVTNAVEIISKSR